MAGANQECTFPFLAVASPQTSNFVLTQDLCILCHRFISNSNFVGYVLIMCVLYREKMISLIKHSQMKIAEHYELLKHSITSFYKTV